MNFQDSLHCKKTFNRLVFGLYYIRYLLIIRCQIEIDRQVKQEQII